LSASDFISAGVKDVCFTIDWGGGQVLIGGAATHP
jgi:hypothetical protein